MSLNLDLTNTKENSFSPIPAGTYEVVVDECEVKETKSQTGEYINTKFKVVGGDHDDRVLWHMFNIKNDNAKAVEIGLGQLKSFMKCAGLTNFNLKDVNDLQGLHATAIVKIRVDEYGEKNVISYFKPVGSDSVEPTAKEASKGMKQTAGAPF